MEAPLYFFKIFTEDAQSGNPAACALLSCWPDTATLQNIAFAADQVVTAFLVPEPDSPGYYHIRWFSAVQEINLCGHGTLAAAALLRQLKGEGLYHFLSEYGELKVTASQTALTMQLPQWPASAETLAGLPQALLACQPVDFFQTRDLVLVLADEEAVQRFSVDVSLIKQLPQHALIVTALSAPDSYVLRYFAPAIGINEDIATGSAQCSLAPYWALKTGAVVFQVRQLSATQACFSVAVEAQQLQLQTQAVYLSHLTGKLATIA